MTPYDWQPWAYAWFAFWTDILGSGWLPQMPTSPYC